MSLPSSPILWGGLIFDEKPTWWTALPLIRAILSPFCPFSSFWRNNHPVGQGLLIHEVSRSHTTTHQIGLLWTSDKLVAETSSWRHKTLADRHHAPGEIRTHNLNRRAAADLHFRRRGNWTGSSCPVLSGHAILQQSCVQTLPPFHGRPTAWDRGYRITCKIQTNKNLISRTTQIYW
jgi:hypothetical protein